MNKRKKVSKFEFKINACFFGDDLDLDLNFCSLQMTKEVTSSRLAMSPGGRMTCTCDLDCFWEREEDREVNQERVVHRLLLSTRILLRLTILVR